MKRRYQIMLSDQLYDDLSGEAAELSKKHGKTVSIASVLRAHTVGDMLACKEYIKNQIKFLDRIRQEVQTNGR